MNGYIKDSIVTHRLDRVYPFVCPSLRLLSVMYNSCRKVDDNCRANTNKTDSANNANSFIKNANCFLFIYLKMKTRFQRVLFRNVFQFQHHSKFRSLKLYVEN